MAVPAGVIHPYPMAAGATVPGTAAHRRRAAFGDPAKGALLIRMKSLPLQEGIAQIAEDGTYIRLGLWRRKQASARPSHLNASAA